jgi:hypothetical protein
MEFAPARTPRLYVVVQILNTIPNNHISVRSLIWLSTINGIRVKSVWMRRLGLPASEETVDIGVKEENQRITEGNMR